MLVQPARPEITKKLSIKLPESLLQRLDVYTAVVEDKSGHKITKDEVVKELLTYAMSKDKEFKEAEKAQEKLQKATSSEPHPLP